MNKNIVVLTIAILAIALVGAEEAYALKGGSNTDVVDCSGESNPVATINLTFVETWTYSASVDIEQEFGDCVFTNENSHPYILPFMPLKYEVELIDTDFDYVVESHIVTGVLDNSFTIELSDVFEDIPYCLKVTSSWMDVDRYATKQIETESITCF